MRPSAAFLLFVVAACDCPVYDADGNAGTCPYPESAGSVTATFNGGQYSTPSCWEASGMAGQEALLEDDTIDFGQAALGLSVFFYANQQNDPQLPACAFASGMSVPLTSNCLSLTATGTNVFVATGGYSSPDGGLAAVGSVTLEAWPADAGAIFSIEFSPDAQLLYLPALNGTTGDAGLIAISGTAQGETLGPVSAGDQTSD